MSHPLEHRVSQVRQAWNRRATIELVCWAAVLLVGVVALGGTFDYIFRPTDRGLRVLISLSVLAGMSVALTRLIRWWSGERWSELSTARHMQQAYPQLGDRVASSLEFLRQEEDDPTAGSAPLRRAVVADATAALDLIPADSVSHRSGYSRALTAAIATVALVLAGLTLAPELMRTSATRVLAPWNSAEWPRQHQLVFNAPPTLLARGETFEVTLTDESGKLPSEVAIEYRYKVDGRKRTERAWMQQVGSTMVARRDDVRRDFEFRATGGDHHTMEWTEVTVVDPPTVRELAVVVHPPEYSGLPSAPLTQGARVLSGSNITLTAKASEPLASAQLVGVAEEPLALKAGGPESRQLSLPSRAWIANVDESSELIRAILQLTSATGIVGEVDLPAMELIADSPPEVAWTGSQEELFVLSGAELEFEVKASDNLALASVGLELRSLGGESPIEKQPRTVSLYQASESSPKRDRLPLPGQPMDTQTFTAALDLTAFDLPVGAALEATALASDYFPHTSATPRPRRITIISSADLDSRLAADQAEILRLLEQALADQRSSQSQAAEVATNPQATRETLDDLMAARLTQQSTERALLDEPLGVVDRAGDILRQLKTNRLERPELVEQLESIASQISELENTSLPAAEQGLTEARKTLEPHLGGPLPEQSRASVADSLAALDKSQQEIIDTLEELIDQANAWSDSERFVRELVRLEQDQRNEREESLEAVRRNIKATNDRDVKPVPGEQYQRMADAQGQLARRFDKLMQSMRATVASDVVSSDFAGRLSSTLAAADSLGVSATLVAAARELNQQQAGRAADTQLAAADALQELIDRLRDRTPTDPGELASRLRKLQRELAKLKQQASKATNAEREQDLSQQLQNVARELQRLTAQAASKTTQQASNTAAPRQGETPEQTEQRHEQARREIEQAERELAQRIAELEGEQQQRLLDRLAEVLEKLIPQQQQALEQTLKLDLVLENQGELSKSEVKQVAEVSDQEAQLAAELDEAMADVEKRAVFQLALGGAADDMRQAATALSQQQTGRTTQNLELAALSRMSHVLEILRDPPPTPPEGEQSEGGGGGGNQPQSPPLIELAEVKMLRWLQADLNGRTRMFEADLADNVQEAAEKRQAAQRLSSEQQELERLVREMMTRNNRNMQRPVEL